MLFKPDHHITELPY